METRKILICSLPLSVESPQPDAFAFCVLLPLPEDRVKLQGAEHYVFLSPQPRIHRTSCLLSTTQEKGDILLLQELREGLLLLSGLIWAFNVHQSAGFPLPLPLTFRGSRAAELWCRGSSSCNAAEMEGAGGQRMLHPTHSLPHGHSSCVMSVFSSLSSLPDFCLQKQSTEHFKTASR